MKRNNEMVLNDLQRFINKVLFLKKKSLFQFRGVKFYPSEIHLLLIIREKSATNATKMADELGVTKGAVSQTLTRLEKKGVLKKTKDPYKKNELTLSFTSFGTAAYKHYSSHAARILKKHNYYLKRFTDKEKKTIQRFLTEAEKILDEIA